MSLSFSRSCFNWPNSNCNTLIVCYIYLLLFTPWLVLNTNALLSIATTWDLLNCPTLPCIGPYSIISSILPLSYSYSIFSSPNILPNYLNCLLYTILACLSKSYYSSYVYNYATLFYKSSLVLSLGVMNGGLVESEWLRF